MGFSSQIDSQSRAQARPLRVLIVRVGAMGDALHGLPAVAALRSRLPDCFIGWAIEPRWRDLLQTAGASLRGPEMPLVDRLHLAPTRKWKQRPFSFATLRQIAALRREMQAEHYDVCVDLQGSIRSAVIGRMAGARCFIGPLKPRERPARAFYRQRVEVTAKNVIEQACELLGAAAGLSPDLSLNRSLAPAAVTLPRNERAELEVADLPTAPTALIVPAAGWGAKQWGVANYRQLATQLQQAGVSVLVNAGSRDDATAKAIAADTGRIAATDLCELIALTRRVSIVIGGDTGPVHLAAALGRPVVALFGPTDPARNGPCFPGAKVKVLRDPESRTDHKRHAETEAGLARITVEEVFTAAMALLRGNTPKDQGNPNG